jgi:hypothetical protein
MTALDYWKRFAALLTEPPPQISQEFVPCVLICLPVQATLGDAIAVDAHGDPVIMWPQEIPIEERAGLFERIARASLVKAGSTPEGNA